jgi:putative peptide zinc metalloprotease protein
MNLAEALNAALPELPQTRRTGFPKLDPRLLAREHVEGGVPVVVANLRGTTDLYRFTPEQWALTQLFDGERSYQQIADLYTAQSGTVLGEPDVKQFAETLESTGFWYKTPQERNIALSQKLAEKRGQYTRKRFKFGDVSRIIVGHWDPDAYLDRAYHRLKFVYSRWFTLLTLGVFAFMVYVFIDRWGEIGADTLRYYTFSTKGFSDLAEFWVLFFIMAGLHETAHGITCKHYGGQVHQMGFHLIFLTPAFFVDVTEAWVFADHWQRLVTIIAGIWVEMIVCAVATVVWWGTAPATFVHDLAYKFMLVTGVAVVLVNMNPLIKLDGYYFFTELIGIADLKEKSTAFVSSWVKKQVWKLPVEVEWVPPRRRVIYVIYALASGVYSYMLLLLVVRFAYNVLGRFTPEWAFVPALALAYFIFRSRLRTLVRFMDTVYLDKEEKVRAWLTPRRKTALGVVALVLLVAPIWRETVDARLLLEADQRAVIRTTAPGMVQRVLVEEGQAVRVGEPVAYLRNLKLEGDTAKALAEYKLDAARATQAQLHYQDYAAAEQLKQQGAERLRTLQEQMAALEIRSPIAGRVVSSRARDLAGSYLPAGKEVAEVADLSELRARLYVPQSQIRDLRPGQEVRVQVTGFWRSRPARVASLAAIDSEIAAGLMPAEEYKGIRPPPYYVVNLMMVNDGSMSDGMTGTAKILVRHISLGGFLWRQFREFLGRKLW